ncbi:MAG: hypothetical protein KBI46_03955 [Phycisphaerae bacterium]|nr:hypothetical protein [Phycisphaerae bacterium]
MKIYKANDRGCFLPLWIAVWLLGWTGCELSSPPSAAPADEPAKMRISSLTEFVPVESGNGINLKILAELISPQGFSIRAPFVMRFELYEYSPVSSNPRGRQIILWPLQDLTDSDRNDQHWKEYLEGYEFLLPVETPLTSGKNYILEATCMIGRRRLGDLFKIEFALNR